MTKGMSPVAKAVGANPKANVRQAPHTSGPGPETKADMSGAFGSPVGDSSLNGAMTELRSQHPHGYADLGPHHGTSDHIRHKPMKLA